jgi:hypothetical protein
MDVISDLLKIALPAGLVLLAMYLSIRTLVSKQFETQLIQLRKENNQTVLPIRLQAYERLCLLLERCTPMSLLQRVSHPSYSAFELTQAMLQDIREELGHNLSQQVYVSHEGWIRTRAALERIMNMINEAADEVGNEAGSMAFIDALVARLVQLPEDPCQEALRFLKAEVQTMF